MGIFDDLRKCFVIFTCLSSVYLIVSSAVTLHVVDKQHIMIDNGLFQLTLSNPNGLVTGIKYNGMDNLLEKLNKEDNRGYWDIVSNVPVGLPQHKMTGRQYEIIKNDTNHVEVSFSRKWDPSLKDKVVPLNTDLRYVVLDGISGFYTYAIYEHEQGWPDFHLGLNRLAFKLSKDKFHYMAISDDRQRIMPMPDDRMSNRSQKLAYPEAVLLTNPINPELKGQVDDKYQYSADKDKARVHGWVTSSHPAVGFWMITPSDEFRTGGPLKQELTSHVGPTTLSVFQSAHYVGPINMPKFTNGEYWKKVFGPLFVYLNNATGPGTDPKVLWEDAKKKMYTEVEKWPYSFPLSPDFQKREQRGSISGRILIQDRYLNKDLINGTDAYVGLALPGEVGSWQKEFKGYQFWTRADSSGNFVIPNVVTGVYDFYAYVPGFVGDYKFNSTINITSGSKIDLGNMVYAPPRDAPTLWEIGIPDRLAAEFFVPDPDPRFVNKLYSKETSNKYRQYGLWERYSDLYPNGDLVFTVGESDYKKDWFFAQVTRKIGEKSYKGTTWQVKFQLASVQHSGIYKLRIALASATHSNLHVRINDQTTTRPHFTTHMIGSDNSIARHGIHGLYLLFNVDVNPTWLKEGNNTIFFTQSECVSPFQGIMYDYIRMEGPSH